MQVIKWVVMCGGLQGVKYYDTEEEARAAAQFRANCTGLRWDVRKLVCMV